MPPKKNDEEALNRDLCKPGSIVFYWEQDHAWAIGKVVEDTGKFFKVQGYDYNATKKGDLAMGVKLGEDRIWPVREDVLDEDFHDLLDLTVLHDATIQRCLFLRYMKDVVYSNIGAIVVALNPWNFKIPWYMDDQMPKYLAEGEVIKENRPHSWAQAHNTYFDLRRDATDQCILISGESGAGKTEAAKIVMKYLGAISCKSGSEEQKEGARKVAFNINQASPILEGFGNAKTVRNDNSSRFGKFMKVKFSNDGFLCGAFTIKYLLEKSRIVTASPNERVYHAFYLVLDGADAGSKYQLGKISGYHTNAGSCVQIPGVDDGDDYRICNEAMTNCGFSDEEKDGIWRVVAGICHLLQVKYKDIDSDSCKIDPGTTKLVEHCCALWQVNADTYFQEACSTVMVTRDGPVTKTLNTVKAVDNRDAMVKTIYDQVFTWEVLAINKLTDQGQGENFIGLLDIFGFEDFEYNTFEQICINLANETLQNHYNNYIFTRDMDECKSEGIDVTEVKCPDNMPCLLLMTAKTGIFGLLDDECSVGKGSDAGFLSKVLDINKKNEFLSVKKLAKNSFVVHHYAASVNYTVEGWLDKNRDTLKPAMKHFVRASAHPLIATLIEEPNENEKKITVGGFFRQQLKQLMDLINSTNPHWIRCVKPHPAKKPLMVDGRTMMEQLESSGVLGTVKIRKAGFPVRTPFAKFVARFKTISGPPPYPPVDSPVKTLAAFCLKICEAAEIPPLKAQAGTSKMFLKNEANQHLEACRDKIIRHHTHTIQALSRGQLSTWVVDRQRQIARFNAAAQVIQDECKVWYVKSQEVRKQREAERKERERVLAELRAKRVDAEAKMKEVIATYTLPADVKPVDDDENALIESRLATLAHAGDVAPAPSSTTCVVAPTALASRGECDGHSSKLAEAWFAKPGDVLDEWLENLKPPVGGVGLLSVLSEAANHLSSKCKATPTQLAMNLCKALLTMEGVDLDRMLCYPDVPDGSGSGYTAQNPPIAAQIARAGTAKWVKTTALLLAMAEPDRPPVDIPCVVTGDAAAAVAGGGGGETAAVQFWTAPLVETPAAAGGAAGGTAVTATGVTMYTSVEEASQYPGARRVMVPPMTAWDVAGGGVKWKGCQATVSVFLKELKDVALADAACADHRLRVSREKLQEKRVEEEKRRQAAALRAIMDKIEALTEGDEVYERQQILKPEDARWRQIVKTHNTTVQVYYGIQRRWVEEACASQREHVADQEYEERLLLEGFMARGVTYSSLVRGDEVETTTRNALEDEEVYERSYLAARMACERKEVVARERLYKTLREGRARVDAALDNKRTAARRRDKALLKLQRLKDDEIERVACMSADGGGGAGVYSDDTQSQATTPYYASHYSTAGGSQRLYPLSPASAVGVGGGFAATPTHVPWTPPAHAPVSPATPQSPVGSLRAGAGGNPYLRGMGLPDA